MTDTNNTIQASQLEPQTEQTNKKEEAIAEITFVEKVRSSMISNGLKEKVAIFDSDSDIKLASVVANKNQERDLVNRFFNTQLCTKGVESIEERFVLIDTHDDSTWLDLFEQKVVPYLLSNDLPIQLDITK